MGLKIIGAGFGRTGTYSMKRALELLGFNKCCHMSEVAGKLDYIEAWRCAARICSLGRTEGLFQGYQAAVDWPVANFWHELLFCEFLGCTVPAEPYPNLNTTAQFQTYMKSKRQGR